MGVGQDGIEVGVHPRSLQGCEAEAVKENLFNNQKGERHMTDVEDYTPFDMEARLDRHPHLRDIFTCLIGDILEGDDETQGKHSMFSWHLDVRYLPEENDDE